MKLSRIWLKCQVKSILMPIQQTLNASTIKMLTLNKKNHAKTCLKSKKLVVAIPLIRNENKKYRQKQIFSLNKSLLIQNKCWINEKSCPGNFLRRHKSYSLHTKRFLNAWGRCLCQFYSFRLDEPRSLAME